MSFFVFTMKTLRMPVYGSQGPVVLNASAIIAYSLGWYACKRSPLASSNSAPMLQMTSAFGLPDSARTRLMMSPEPALTTSALMPVAFSNSGMRRSTMLAVCAV